MNRAIKMTDLTQAIHVLQYGPLFDMLDRRTGAALLMVNKPISKMVTEYVHLPTKTNEPPFHPCAFEAYKDYCIIRYDDQKVIINVRYRGLLKCSWSAEESIPGWPCTKYYVFHVHGQSGTIFGGVTIPEKKVLDTIVASYQEYERRYADLHKK